MPSGVTPERLAQVREFDDLATLLFEELGWPTNEWKRFSGVAPLYGLTDIGGAVTLEAVQQIEDETWGIFLVDFGDSELKRSDLRRILHKVADRARQEHAEHTWPHETILFIVRHDGHAFTLGQFRGDKLSNAKLRRFGWTSTLEARTAVENLNRLQWGKDWSEAFNVEKLTKDFFTKLSDLFYDICDALKAEFADDNACRLYVQTLFNRLIFLRFVEKKGWLRLPLAPMNGGERGLGGEGSRSDYLRALWEAGQSGPNPFWPTRLNRLFNALNHETGDTSHVEAAHLIGDVPYLNGGLFEEDLFAKDSIVAKVPQKVFAELLGPDGLFYRYNFTVEESSPLDVQVAVDPEILGKIFEQLTISGKRHDTGSYYTPREIVQFMCREALVGYLGGKGLEEAKARALVYDHDTGDLTNNEGNLAFEALKAIKVVDPACGSGAYLLGMLQELYALFALLKRDDRKFSQDEAKEEHDRKLWIIENNIYGVDLQAFASNTAMLRLWLTLLVEDSGTKPQPLPNLEYKIETGDSLLGPDPSQPIDWSKTKKAEQSGLDFENVHDTVADLRKLREDYQNAHGEVKKSTHAKLDAKLGELREKVTRNREKDPAKFDWRVEFFDVFLDDPDVRQPGFDVVIMNPPYVSRDALRRQSPDIVTALRANYATTRGRDFDLFGCFIERGVGMLKPLATLSLIVASGWYSGSGFGALRRFVASQSDPQAFVNLPYDIFAAAWVDTTILVATRRVAPTGWPRKDSCVARLRNFEKRERIAGREDFERDLRTVDIAEWFSTGEDVFLTRADSETMRLIRRIEASSCPLGDLSDIQRGVTPFNLTDKADNPRSKPAFAGTVRRYCVDRGPIRFIGFDDSLTEPKPERYFAGPRLLLRELVSRQLRLQATYVEDEFVTNKSMQSILPLPGCPPLEFLLGCLNSSRMSWLFLQRSNVAHRDDFPKIVLRETRDLPIPRSSDADQNAIVALVQQILDLKAADPASDVSEQEAEIDARVEFLYFHQDEAPTYDAWLAKREAERGTIVEDVRKLLAIGHETMELECKSTFLWGVEQKDYVEALKDQVHIAICALLNAKGGDLLIGVEEIAGDKLNVRGLAEDLQRYGGKDGLLSAIEQPLGKTLTPNPIGLIDIKPVEIDGHMIVRVHVKPDNTERYRFKDQIYVRRNSKSKPALTADEAASWWPKRQRGEV